MREGQVSHADLNQTLRLMRKTVIFGMQDRLRNGVLIDGDEILPRFPAGSPLLEFFYRGLKRLPRHLIRAILKRDISVTLVGGKGLLIFDNVTTRGKQGEREEARESGEDLLVFQDVRNQQSFHIGFTRKTICTPEGILRDRFRLQRRAQKRCGQSQETSVRDCGRKRRDLTSGSREPGPDLL